MTEREYIAVGLLRQLEVAERVLCEARKDAMAIQHDSEGTIISAICRLGQITSKLRADLVLDGEDRLKTEKER